MAHQATAYPYEAVWHDDGDLIVKVVQNGDCPVDLHRVHSGPLKLHSTVFRDMVGMAQYRATEEPGSLLHGCPVLDLEDDPGDVCRLLRVLYYPGVLHQQKLRQSTFNELEPVLRLATKYKMTDMVNRYFSTIEQDWPSTLHRWDINEVEIELLHEQIKPLRDLDLDMILPEPCRVIRLARQCGFHSILPAAFYHLSRIELDHDNGEENFRELRHGSRRAARRYLSTEDWNSLYRGMGEIRKWCRTLISTTLPKDFNVITSQCMRSQGKQACQQSLSSIVTKIEKKMFAPAKARRLVLDPLRILRKDYTTTTSNNENKPLDMCSDCQERVRKKLLEKRAEFWKRLPSFFLLPNWSPTNRADGGLKESIFTTPGGLIGGSAVLATAVALLVHRFTRR